MADYTDDLALIVRYDGTKAAFETVKSNYLGKVVFIYGSATEATTDSAKAALLQAVWVSDENGGRYLDMANVDYIRNNLTHISGITVDGKTYYPSSGGGAITLTGANGINVTVNTSTGAVIFDGKTLSLALIGTTDNASNTSSYPDTIKGAKAYAEKLRDDLKGTKATDDATAETIRGAKDYADAKVAAAKSEIVGTVEDDYKAATIIGAKMFAETIADDRAIAAKDAAIAASKTYVDPLLNGKADLENGKIKESQLPDFIFGQMLFGGVITNGDASQIVVSVSSKFKDRYDITTDQLTIPKADYTKYEGAYFIVSEAAGDVLGLGTVTGDWVVSNGIDWEKIDNTDAVASVAGLTGTITASALAKKLAATGDANELALLSEVTAKYTKPSTGIPKTDLASAVQTSLGNADTAIQGVSTGDNYINVESAKDNYGVLYMQSKVITAKTAEVTSMTDTTDGLATVADIRAFLKARLSVKVVS